MCDPGNPTFSVGSSLELLAAIASLPKNPQSCTPESDTLFISKSIFLPSPEKSCETPDISSEAVASTHDLKADQTLQDGGVSEKTLNSSRRNFYHPIRRFRNMSPLSRRTMLRLHHLRRRMDLGLSRVSVDPKIFSNMIINIERDLLTLLKLKNVRKVSDVVLKKQPKCENKNTVAKLDVGTSPIFESKMVVFANEQRFFVDASTQTQTTNSSSLDIDCLDPTVTISPVDFNVSFSQDGPDMTIESSSLVASGHLLDTFLEKVEKSDQACSVETLPSVPKPPTAPGPDFNPKDHQFTPTFINMFWNTFPALSSDSGHVFIRLADISSIALPAKDSATLKQRCIKLGINVYFCTDMQRDFLVKYCLGSSRRSLFMVDCQAAKLLLASYCQDRMKEHGLTTNDMQVVVLSEEESKRLISARLNVCSTKYGGSHTNDGINNAEVADNSTHVLRRRVVTSTPTPVPTKKKTVVKKCPVVIPPVVTPDTLSSTVPVEGTDSSRHRLWSHMQIYNASVHETPGKRKCEGNTTNIPNSSTRSDLKETQLNTPPNKKRKLATNLSLKPSTSTRRSPRRLQTVSTETQPQRCSYAPMRYSVVLLTRSKPIQVQAVGQMHSFKASCHDGNLTPHLFLAPNAPCIQCNQCQKFFSPLSFTRHCGGKKIRACHGLRESDRATWLTFCRKLKDFHGYV